MIDFSLGTDIIVTDKLQEAFQELDILFNTTPTELIGNTSYGVNFLQFLWQLTPNDIMLERYIREKIQANTFYVKQFSYDLNITSKYDEAELIYIVSISLHDNASEKKVSKQYIIR